MFTKNSFFILSLLFIAIIFCSCSPSIKIAVSEENKISYSFSATIADCITDIAKSFSELPEESSLFDSNKIQQTLQNTGLKTVSVEQPAKDSIEVSGDFIATANQTDLSFLDKAISVSPSEISLNLSTNVIQDILDTIPAETAEYIELLSAPILTGEEMSSEEYTELIAAVYGEKASNALNESKVQITLIAEKPITNAKASISKCFTEINNKKAVFSFPLADFLTHSEEIVFCIQF